MEPPCSNPSPGVFESNSFDNLVQTLESIFKLAEGRGGGGGQGDGGGNGAAGRAAGASLGAPVSLLVAKQFGTDR